MSLLAKNTGLILLSALLIFSCKEKENVGLELPADNNKIGTVFIDTLSLRTTAILENDSIPTYNQDYAYVGAFNNDVFGDVNAEAYIQVFLSGVIPPPDSINKGLNVESVEMTLGYTYFYGDTTENQTINVRKLTAPIQDIPYFSTANKHAYDNSEIQDKDSVWQARPIRDNATLKLQLKNSFGDDIIDLLEAGKTTNALFVPAFQGIALVPKEVDKGMLMRIDLHDNSSKITINYKVTGGTKVNTLELTINNGGERYSRIVSNRTGTPLAKLINSGDTVNTNEQIYVQSGLGVRTKIEFPGLDYLKEKLGNVGINRAELVLEADPITKPDDYLILYKLNSAGDVRKYWNGTDYINVLMQTDLSDLNGNSSPLIVYHNPTTKVYTLNISSYINAIIQGKEENNGLIITQLQERYRTTPVLITDPNKVKLKVYYTKATE